MIRVSDNAATNVLISRLGMGRIDALAREIGLHHTTLRRKMVDFGARARGEENTTSASDTAVLIGEIRVGVYYPHKTGQLESVENDAGIVLLPERTFAPAVLVQGDVGHAAGPVSSATGWIFWQPGTERFYTSV